MIHWSSRICETCKHWIKDENECPYHGNDMIVVDCSCYEEGEQKCCSNCKHWGSELSPCDKCYYRDEWEAKEE